MAKAFNLTAQINLQGPSNIGSVVGKIKKELGSVGVDVKLNINAKSVKSVDNLTSKLKVMNEVLMKSKNYTDSLNASLSQLSSSLNKTGGSTNKISKGLKNTASESLTAAKNLKQAEDAMTGLGKQAAVTIKRFAAFSIVSTVIYGVVNSVNQAYKAFLEFDKEMIRLQQITGSGAVAIGKLSSAITELSTTLGVSSTELSRVAVTLAQAGFTASQTEQALSALAKTELAPSFDNLTRTTEGAIAAIRQFGLDSKDLEKSLGSINAVASKFAVESGDIIAAIQRTGGVFASASKGVSEGTDALNEFVAVFTSVRSTTRESAETIATGLRTIFTRIQRGSTIDYLKQFNIELQDSEGNFVGAYEAVKRLSEGLKGLDTRDVRFTRIVEELGGFRQIGKVIPLIQEFRTSQEALAVAQKGQDSLTEASAKAQQSLIVQLTKVREEFNALIRSVGESKTFKTFLSLTLQTTRALVGLAGVFKPILPLLAILGTLKAVSSIGKFGAGFSGALKKGGGSKGVGQTIGEKLTGASEKEKSDAVSRAASATNQNTTALKSLTSAVNALTQKIGNLGGGGGGVGGGGGGPILGPDGRPYRFATGGIVPGSGNRDTVPAMLTPGEFVIRKKAVETIGAGNLQKMNRYASGGKVQDLANMGKKSTLLNSVIQNKSQLEKKGGQEFIVSGPEPSRFNPRDLVTANIQEQKFDVNDLKNKAPKASEKYFKAAAANNPQERGKQFENVLEEAGIASLARDKEGERIGSARMDGMIGSTPAEVKSYTSRTISRGELLKKGIGSAIRGSRDGAPGEALAGKLTSADLTTSADRINLGDITLLADETTEDFKGLREEKKDKTVKTVRKVKMAALGGLIKKYGIGGGVLATDTIGAAIMEQTGDLASTTIPGSEIISNTLRDRQLNEEGLANMEKRLQAIFGNRSYNYVRAGIDGALGIDIGAAIDNRVIEMINNLGTDLNFPGIMQGAGDNFLSTLNAGVKGGIFEAILNTIKNSGVYQVAQTSSEKNDFFDFRNGLGEAGKWFPSLSEIAFVDAKKSLDAARTSNIARKIGNEGLREAGSMSLEELYKLAEESQGSRSIEDTLLNAITEDFGSGAFSRGLILPLIGEGKESLNSGFAERLKAIYKTLGLSPQQGNAILRKLFGAATGKKWDGKAVSLANRLNLGGFVQRFAEGGEPDPNAPSAKQLGFLKSLVKKFYDDDASIERFLSEVYDKGSASKKIQGLQNAQKWISLFKQLRSEGHMVDLFGANARPYAYPKIGNDSMPFDDLGDEEKIREYLRRGKLAFGSSVGQMKGRYGGTRSYSASGRSSYYRRALGGFIQRFAEGGESKKEKDFGEIILSNGSSSIIARYNPNSTRTGFVKAKKWKDGIWTVGLSQASKGYGPKLYDVAMEGVTELGGMLTSDRATVSGDAKKVWQYYFKNRPDVQKIPLPRDAWTGNYAMIDEKLRGPEDTWPPKDDPAWTLQTGYRKSPSLINDPSLVKRISGGESAASSASMALSYFSRYANGGAAEDTVPALLTPGEFVINKKAAARIGASNLHRMNRADKIQGYNSGGSVGFIQRFADGGAAVGGLGHPGSMPTTPAAEAAATAEALEALKEAAKNAGMSVKRYEKTIKDQIKTLASSKVSEKEATRKDLAGILIRNRGEIKKAGAGSKEIQAFKDTLVAKLRDLDLDLPVENIENEVVGVINSIKSGLPVEDILKRSEILKKAMDNSGDAAKALKEAHDELRASVGDLTENMKVSAEELANAKYVDSGQAERDFGAFGKFAPGFAQAFANSDKGRSSIQKSRDILAMRNIPLVGESLGKLNDAVMDMEGPLGNAARAVGGLAGASAIATSILGSQLPQAFEALGLGQNATAAGVAGGLAEGGSQAASFGTIGYQLFGPQGAVAGLLVGAISGAISGFAKAFRTKNLENKLGELNTTLESVDKAFENLAKNRNAETLREAQSSLGGLAQNFETFQAESQRTFGEAITSFEGITGSASLIGGGALLSSGISKGFAGVGLSSNPITALAGLPLLFTGIGESIAGLGLTIYGAYSLLSSANPDEIDKEAFDAGLKAAQEYVEGLSKLAEQEINLKSLETIKDTLDPIQEAYDKIEQDQKSGNITAEEAKTRRQNLNIQLGKQSTAIEQAQFSALAKEGYTVDPLKPLADQLSTIDSRGQNIAQAAKDQAAYMAGVAELNRIYGEGSALARKEAEDKQKTTNRGYELLGVEYKQQLIQAELAATYRETRIEVENLIDKFDKVNAVLNRFGTELDELSRQGDILAGMGSGEAELGPINRTNEAMLANMRAYSDAELAPVIEQVGRIAGGETGSQLTEGLQARRILQENLPDILNNVSGQDTERVETEVRDLFDKAGLSEDLGRTFAEEVRKSLDKQQGSRQGKSFQELTQEFPALQESMNLIEKQFEVSSNTLKQYNDAIEQSNEFITRWGQALEKSRELTLKSAQLEIETRNKLLRATGGYVGPTQENEAFLEQIASLTGGQGVKGNQILIDEIGRQYNDLSKQVEDQRALVNATQDFAERQKQTKKLDELNRQMNNSYTALEEIANNTSMIDSLISAIERNRGRSEAAGRFVEDTFASSPLEIAEDTLNLGMLNDFLDLDLDTARGRNRANRMYGSQESRQRIVQGLDYLEGSGMLGEQEMGRIRAEAQIQMIKQIQSDDPNFAKQKIVTMETYNPETKKFEIGEKISVEEAVRARADGTYKDPMQEALTDQLLMQKDANDILREIADNTAKEQDELALAITDMVNNLPGVLAGAVSQSRTESEARDAESPSSGDSAGSSAPPEPEMFADEEISRIRSDLEAANKATGLAMKQLQEIKDRRKKRDESWFNKYFPFFNIGGGADNFNDQIQMERLEKEINTLKEKERKLQEQLTEAVRRKMEEEATAIPPKPPVAPEETVLPPSSSDQPIPVEVKNPILPSLPEIPGAGPMGGCCNEILDEIRLLKQVLIANTFLMDLGNTISNAFSGFNIPLRLEPSSQDFLNSFSQSFNTYVTRLENALPDQIQIVGRHSVSVTISGGEVFNEMEGSIKRMVLSEVNKELTAYATKNGLPAPETRGNPVGE